MSAAASILPRRRASLRVEDRARVFGIEARDNWNLLPVARLGLFVLFFVAPLVALLGFLILMTADAARDRALNWFEGQRARDLAARAAASAESAALARCVLCIALGVESIARQARRLPAIQPRAARAGRVLPSPCLTPRILSQRPCLPLPLRGLLK